MGTNPNIYNLRYVFLMHKTTINTTYMYFILSTFIIGSGVNCTDETDFYWSIDSALTNQSSCFSHKEPYSVAGYNN